MPAGSDLSRGRVSTMGGARRRELIRELLEEFSLETIKAYIALTKPRVIELLLVATIPAMLQAARGENNIVLILLTLVGGWMGAAAANTFIVFFD